MNRKQIFSMIVLAASATAMPAASQIRFGARIGCDIARMSFNSKMLDSDNRAGFTVGAMLEFTAPVINLGFDISAMYVRRTTEFRSGYDIKRVGRDYIEIPVNIKYKLAVPAIERIVMPFVTTGPSVSFLTSSRSINRMFRNNECDAAWNFGFGLELFSRVQLAANYGLGLSKSIMANYGMTASGADGKNRYWTVTASYLF